MATSTNFQKEAACATELDSELDLNAINIVDLDFRDESLYLIVEEKVKQEFSKLNNDGNPQCAILRNMKHRVLVIVKGGKMAVFEEMTDSEVKANAPRTQFIIQLYKETNPTGFVVAISVKTSEKTYTLSCKDKKLQFKEGAAPDKIDGKDQDVLFYKEYVKGNHNKMQFKSLLYKEYYLACKREKKGIFKLILKKKDKNEEESTSFYVQLCEKTDP